MLFWINRWRVNTPGRGRIPNSTLIAEFDFSLQPIRNGLGEEDAEVFQSDQVSGLSNEDVHV